MHPAHNGCGMDVFGFAALRAFVLGLAVGASARPLAHYIVSVAITHGRRAGRYCAFGAAIAHFTGAVIVFGFATRLEDWAAGQRTACLAVSSAVLAAIGAFLVVTAWTRAPAPNEEPPSADLGAAFATAYRLALIRPVPLLMFLAVAVQLPLAGTWEDSPRYAAFMFIGSFVAQSAYVLLGRPLSPALWRTANLVSGLIAGALALYALARALA
jgi:threonine/homoserine/homoserine lactone efflux protein